MAPRLDLPPLKFCLGFKPKKAANCAPFLNCLKYPTVAAIADAVSGPKPLMTAARYTCASSVDFHAELAHQWAAHMSGKQPPFKQDVTICN